MKTNLIENRQIRVFISSTFQDMQDERDYLMKRTFPKLRKLAAERDVTLTELDLRWGITEEEAKTGKVVEICLREIENSIPFFIGIIGDRYGWVPEMKDIGKNVTERFKDVNNYLKRHLSVTEMEMQFGVLQRNEDMHAYFYIKEGEEKDNADYPEMLERLKKEVKASRYPFIIYSSPENLGIQVEQAFRTLLDQLFPEGNLSELEKERIGQRSFMRQLCQNYIRDDKNFQVLDDWMQDWNQHQMVVTGASGLGKSALIANWLKEKLSDENRGYNIIYHFTGNGGSESSHEHIIKTLIDEINDVYGWEANDEMNKQLKDKQDDKLNDLFIKVASEGKKPLLIVLDAINQIVDTENAKLLNWLPIPPKNIKILFSTLEDDRTMEVFSNRHYPVFILQPISLKQRKQLVTEYLEKFGKKLTEKQIERITADKQCENTLVLKTLLDELINFGVYEKLDERIEYYLLPDSIEDFYQALLKSYEEDYNGYCEDFTKHVLSLIVLSRNGLSEEEILKATGIKPLYWSQFYCAFSTHLVSKEGLISFAHRYVQNAVSARYLENDEWVRACRNEILKVVDDANTIRYLEEQTYQLDQLSEYEKLHDLLLNLEFFSIYYVVHPYELGDYWRKLIAKGYSISEYLQVEDHSISENDKAAYFFYLGIFSSGILADYDKALEYHMKAAETQESLLGENHPDTAMSYACIGSVYLCKGDYDKALEYHLKALKISESLLGQNHPDTATSYVCIGLVYYYKGDYDEALEYYLKALKTQESLLGENHPDTAGSYVCIGSVYHCKGDYDEALEYYLKALKTQESLLGENHPDTARSYNNIGSVYHCKGDYDKALEYYLKALKISESLLGQNHPHTATSYNNIGIVYKAKGDHDEALEYHMKALKILESLLGENHPDTAMSYNSIGLVYSDKGDYDEALEYHLKALEIRESVLGQNHPDTARSYNNIGLVYSDKGDYDKALEYYLKALKTCESVLGQNHPDTATSYGNIGSVYLCKGDYDEALEYYLKELKTLESVLGQNHPDTARSYNNIGIVYSDKGDYDKALEYYLKALKIKESVLGQNHPDTATSYACIGSVYSDKGDYDKALEYYLKALKIKESVLGQNHPDTATSYVCIGSVYSGKGDYDKALEYYLKALKTYESVMGQNHPDTAMSYNSIGLVYSDKGDYDKALEYYLKALKISESLLGENHPNTAGSYNNIGLVYHCKGDYDKALEYYMKAVKTQESVLGENHPDTATSYNNIGSVYNAKGDYDKALEYYMKALKISEAVLGQNHPDTATSYNNIGSVYSDKGDYDKALEYHLKALEIRESVLGENHPHTADSYNNIGIVYSYKGDYDEALEYHLKALKIRESVLGENHPDTATSYNNIAWTLHLLGRYEDALPWAEKAVAAFPNNPYIINTIASVYQDLGRYDEAFDWFSKAKQQGDADSEIFLQKKYNKSSSGCMVMLMIPLIAGVLTYLLL